MCFKNIYAKAMYIFWVRVGYCSNEHGFQKPWLAEKWSHHFAAAFFFSMENQIPAHCVCFAYEWIMSCQDSHMNESQFAYGFAYEWVMIRIWMGIRIWMSHDSHMNGSCHVRIPIWTAAMLERWPPFAYRSHLDYYRPNRFVSTKKNSRNVM